MIKKIRDFFKIKKEVIKENLKAKKENLKAKKENLRESLKLKKLRNYKIKDDKIIANYGLFNKKVIMDNTPENIELLNDELRRQHENTDIDEIVNKNRKWNKASYITALSGIGFSLINIFLTPVAPWVALPSFILSNICLAGYIASMVGYCKTANDINRYDKVVFLDNNKDILNEEIKHSDTDTLTKQKIKYSGFRTQNTILNEKHEKREIFDINTIDKMSLDGLRQIKANLEALRTPVVENADGPRLVLENN